MTRVAVLAAVAATSVAGLLVGCGNDDDTPVDHPVVFIRAEQAQAPIRLRPQVVMVDEAGAVRAWSYCVAGRAVYVSVRSIAQGAIGSCVYGQAKA